MLGCLKKKILSTSTVHQDSTQNKSLQYFHQPRLTFLCLLDGVSLPVTTDQQPVLVDKVDVAAVLWTEASATQDLHATAVKRVRPLTGSPKLTVP